MRKMDVKSAVIEDISGTNDAIKDEYSALCTYFGDEVEKQAYKLTFVSEKVSSLEEVQNISDHNFLSSAIIINFKDPSIGWRSYLYIAFVTTPKINDHPEIGTLPLLNNYLHIYKRFKCSVSVSDKDNREYNLTGTFFCQQNGITSVCAHASLCMIINNMNLDVGIISPEGINKIIGVDHRTIKFHFPKENPMLGLNNVEIQTVLNGYGLAFTFSNFFLNPNTEYNDFIYKYIESKCPVLLVFSTDSMSRHVVPILGHTLNTDMWRPEAEAAYSPISRLDNYKPASAWVDHFIMHDDNFGMYYCLPVDALKRVTLPKYDPNFRAHYALAIIPSGVTTPAWEAEMASILIVEDILDWRNSIGVDLDIWTSRLMSIPKNRIVRTFLSTKEAYGKHLEEEDFTGNRFSDDDKTKLTENLPDRFWLSEITLPALYTANKTKIIDVIYQCNTPELTSQDGIFQRWVQIRFPNVLITQKTDGMVDVFPLEIDSHYPLLRFESVNESLDW